MAQDLKAKWSPQGFPGCEQVEFQLYRGGEPLGNAIALPTADGARAFFAADAPGIPYAAHVRGIYSWTPCEIEVVEGGSSGSGSGSGGGS